MGQNCFSDDTVIQTKENRKLIYKSRLLISTAGFVTVTFMCPVHCRGNFHGNKWIISKTIFGKEKRILHLF